MAAELRYRFLAALEALPFVEAVYLYGSRARGEHQPRSDIDLAVLCPSADTRAWHRVLAIIEERDTLLHVDCLRLDALPENSPVRERIRREGRLLYQRMSP